MAVKKKSRSITYMELVTFILKPFIAAALSVTGGSLFLRWIFEYQMRVEHVADYVWLFWIPGFLALLFWVLLLRRKVNLLDIPDGRGNGEFVWHAILILSLGLTGIFWQLYQKRSSLSLLEVVLATDIDSKDWHTCYDLELMEIQKNRTTGDQFSHVSGKHNERLHYEAYILAPFGKSSIDGTIFWVGKTYTTTLRNRSSNEEKQGVWQSHYRESFDAFLQKYKRDSEYLYPVQRGEDYENYSQAINRFDWPKGTQHRVFEFYDGDLKSDANSMLLGSVISFFSGVIFLLLVSLRGVKNKLNYLNFRKGKGKLTDMEQSTKDFLLLKGERVITALIVYATLLIYIMSAFNDGNLFVLKISRLMDFGALSKSHIYEGEYWRLITYIFLHVNFVHIVYNLMLFVLIGVFLEPRLGKLRFMSIYLLTGLGSAFLSLQYNDSVSVGASGAIYGLIGWFISSSLFYKRRMNTSGGLLLLVVGYVVLSFLLSLLTLQVDHYGHLGGLLTGMILGTFITVKRDVNLY